MRINEISVDRFNNLAYAEPEASIFQHSCWSDYKLSKDTLPLFLEYADDSNAAHALAMLLLKKESLFSNKLTAYCPGGYLINYYDHDLLRSFNQDLVPFLKQRGVRKLVIEPTVHQQEGKCDNSVIVQTLQDMGYVKSADLYSYEIDTASFKPTKGIRNVVLKVMEIEEGSEDFQKLFADRKQSEDVRLYTALKPYSHIYVIKLDSFKTKRALDEAMKDCVNFIVANREDYKFDEKIAEKEATLKQIKNISATVKRYEKFGEDPILAGACIVYYSDKCALMYDINIEKDDPLLSKNILFDRLAQEAGSKGFKVIESRKPFAYAVERQLLGEFSLKI